MPSWIVRQTQRAKPRIRLFCFPFAGGAASAFHSWPESLPSDVEVCAIQLPGRETRLGEPLLTSVDEFVDAARSSIAELIDMPTVFFGHSMGALLAYSIACSLEEAQSSMLRRLFVSARRAPHLPDTRPPMHSKPRAEFIEALRDLHGTPPEILANDELMALLLPTIRADFAICETYSNSAPQQLSCALTALGGSHDAVTAAELEAWSIHTDGPFSCRAFDGGHFYLKSHRDELLGFIGDRLRADLDVP